MSGPVPPVAQRRSSRPLPTPPIPQLAQLDLNDDGILDAQATEGLPSYRDSIVPETVAEEPPQLEPQASVRVSAVREKQALEEYGQAHTPAGSEKGSNSNQVSPTQTEWSHIPFPEPQPSPRRPQYPDQPTPTYSEKDRSISRRTSTQRPTSAQVPISPDGSENSVVPFPAPPASTSGSDTSVVPFPAPLVSTPARPVTPPRTTLTEKQRLERHYRAQENQAPPPALDLTNAPDEQIVRGAPPIPPAYGTLTSSPSTSRRRTDGVPLPPTELQRVDYGSRFIPHSYAPITSTLAVIDGFSLLGTSQGLSALADGPNGGVKPIWTGFPVWDMKLLRHDGSNEAPRGTVLFHCGGIEDGSTGRPKKDAEARVYKLDALLGLARWASQQDDYEGLDLGASRKGKGKAFSIKGSFNSKTPPKRTSASRQGEDLAVAWANEYNTLPGDTTNVMSISTFIKPEEINIAVSTPNSIIVHVGTQTPAGPYTFAPPRPFYIPFTPTTFSFVELEIQGSLPESREDNGSSLFEWDDAESIMDIGEAVVGRTLGLFTTFTGARGCVIRTADSGVVELKKGGRGEWLQLQRVRSGEAEVYLFTRGAETFVFPAPLAAPLAIQAPIADLTWPELPIAVHAIPGTRSDIKLLGITASGTIHVIDITALAGGGIQKDWASVQGVFGTKARFLGTRGDGGVDVASKMGDKEWRVLQLHG